MSSIFISYAKKDKKRVVTIIDFLSANGHLVWWDESIKPGTRWADKLEVEIQKADVVVVVWSANAILSEWVKTEASKAKQLGKYVPLVIDDIVARLPLEFSAIEVANFLPFEHDPAQAETRLLLETIQLVATKEPLPADAPVVIPERREKRGLARWETVVAVVAATLGIPLTILNIYAAVKPNTTVDEKHVEEYRPRIEFKYISLEEGDAMPDTLSVDPKVRTFLNYNKAANDLVSVGRDVDAPDRTNYLLIENRSKRAVNDLELVLLRFNTDDTISIKAGTNKDYDYGAQLSHKKLKTDTLKIQVPFSLETSEGILVPLFLSVKPKLGATDWIFTSRNICLPLTLHCKDAFTGEPITVPVRKLYKPTVFSGGIEVGG